MTSVSTAVKSSSEFDKATDTRFIGQYNNASIYAGAADSVNDRYVASIVLDSVLRHFSTKYQQDPIAMNCFFLKKTDIGHLIVEITEIKMSSKGYCIVRASVKQRKDLSRPLGSIDDYEPNEWIEKLHSIITMGNMNSEKGLTMFTNSPQPPSTEHLVPFKYRWMGEHVNAKFDVRNASKEDFIGRPEVTQLIGFSDGRPVDSKSIPYYCDMFITPPALISEEVHGGPIWCPTMQMEVQFKAKVKKDTSQILAHFLAPNIINNRFDIDGQIWDEDGTLLALTRHQCLIVSWSRNTKNETSGKRIDATSSKL
ncbi:hypothetical protein G6F70_002193 [Rhizopus microsporus]|nr:hypothetical protein G6F71_002268 [Rhizopus microsporus]KAG1202513.1 hypothetical protein G6F70_002193 [Rhizopus microsporus]KAG1213741.1 hypothetical protein G6F69_002540 [Rhizopus microsporus]KAG1235963.1 hypothetical protein G6F67_002347 [Rhizopus microsporus]KAG1262773.1 hypothetical protein G6F68_005661 [Rhizopus microsporus]